jgi:hypothetical protein
LRWGNGKDIFISKELHGSKEESKSRCDTIRMMQEDLRKSV